MMWQEGSHNLPCSAGSSVKLYGNQGNFLKFILAKGNKFKDI